MSFNLLNAILNHQSINYLQAVDDMSFNLISDNVSCRSIRLTEMKMKVSAKQK